ncbi:hypothetical protein C1646_775158 [Rhizophagus diaphanus]|nr:hypothetical protein C1646_775158 [Rhizophagus diaphanus] [Rhizophagus sp. MUCL 43196]
MSFASDGASVMLGRSTGVASRRKERNECLFIIHCIAHRLALACNSAEKKIDFCKYVEHVINKFIKLDGFLGMKQSKICLLIEPLMDTLLKIITSTSNNSQRQNFISLYTEICDWKLVVFLHFLWDILGYLSTLSKVFQRKNIQISDIDPIIELTLNKIQQQFLNYDDDGRLPLDEHLNKILLNFSRK